VSRHASGRAPEKALSGRVGGTVVPTHLPPDGVSAAQAPTAGVAQADPMRFVAVKKTAPSSPSR